MIDLHGKRALVTGGTRGIGAATATLLAAAGASVGVAYRTRDDDAEELVAALKKNGGAAFAFRGDLSTREANERFLEAGLDAFGGVDIVVGNSGIWPPNPIDVENLDDARWRNTMAINLDGMFFLARASVPVLSPGGRLVFVSSTAGQRGEAGHADYAATKGAMISFVKSLAVELGPRDITVNCVAPGWVDTEAVRTPFAGEGRARIEAAIPLRRVASPLDIAGPIVFLASALARHVTGEVLNVNGGSVLCG